MKKVLMTIAAVLITVAVAPSCQKEYKPSTPDSVALYTHPGNPVSFKAGTKAVTITATTDWTASSSVNWITVSPSSGSRGINEVVLSYTENTGSAQRSGSVVFTSKGGYSESYELKQNPQQ